MSAEREEYRLRQAFRAEVDAEPRDSPCPEAQRIWAARAGELSARARRALVDHMSQCADCAEAWRLADEMQRGLPESGLARPRTPALAILRWRPAALLPAAAVVLVSLGSLAILMTQGHFWSPPESGYREGRPGEIRSLIPEDQPLPRDRCLLRWAGAPAASRYDAVVTTEDLQPLAEARGLLSAELLVRPSELEPVASGARILWRVEATLPDGSRVASPTFVARVR